MSIKDIPDDHRAIMALHMVYHERDFRVRVNDPTINFVRRQLGLLFPKHAQGQGCPACAAGLNYLDLQPNNEDHR